MSVKIAETAVVDPAAQLGHDVVIGHFCVIGPQVKIGDRTRIETHVNITGDTTIGRDNHIFPHCSLGSHPQDSGYRGGKTRVVIGDSNVLREQVTVNRATEKQDGLTSIGDNNYLMTGCHVAHDCRVGSRNVMANNCMLGGHVSVEDDVTIAGGVGVNQFGNIGRLSFVSAMSKVLHDVPPFMIVEGDGARPRAVNSVGLRRNDYTPEDIAVLTAAFKLLYRDRVGIEAARERMFATGPIRPVLRYLFDRIDFSKAGRAGRGNDRRKAA